MTDDLREQIARAINAQSWIGMCSCRRGIRCNDEATMAAFMDECAADHTERND